jgi:hypothetical protein
MNTIARKTVAKLTTLESYKLCNWLMSQTFEFGDTRESLAKRAATELENPRINVAHIKDRLSQLELTIPEKALSQNNQLRKDISFIAQFLVDTLSEGRTPFPPELRWIAARVDNISQE